MSAVRDLAKSSAAFGIGGAVAGGYAASETNSSIGRGMLMGAAIGAGGRLGLAAGRGLKSGGNAFMNQGLRGIGATNMAPSRKAYYGEMVGGFQKRLNRMNVGRAGMIGGAAGGGYATLESNQGKTYSKSTLAERIAYHRKLRGL
jgi:hypothetical protein